jgi:hypothetical protein
MGDRVIQHSVVDGGVAEAARSLQDTHGLLVGNGMGKRAETLEAREQGVGALDWPSATCNPECHGLFAIP